MGGSRYSSTDRKYLLLKGAGSLVFILVVLLPLQSLAKIKDGLACSECHTMHNSQDGAGMTPAGMEAQAALLNNSCAGCHTGTNTNPAATGTPYVFDSSGAPTYGATGTSGHDTLAGGNFYWAAFGSHRKGHNVAGITSPDDLYAAIADGGLGLDVPGTSFPLGAGDQLTCAGATGCHGNGSGTELESLRPASHHVIDDPTLGTTVPNSFRFLSGIIGFEDPDWEFTITVTPPVHNQYKGGAGTDTISSLCASCHGDFHLSAGGSPFVRHPTDVSLPDVGSGTEYASYVTYKPETPVASVTITAALENVSGASNRIVSCVSCHRAHGSPYDALMRWDYKSWPPSSATVYYGCGDCHSSKK